MESRGNVNYTDTNGIKIGIEHMASTLHFGPNEIMDKWETSTYEQWNETGYNNGFHKYEFIWNETGIQFFVDSSEIGSVPVGEGF